MYFLLWIVLGFGAATIGAAKGRSWTRWLLAGLLTGPIGLLVAIGVPVNREGTVQRQLHDGRARKCPNCAEVILAEATVCRHCGRDVSPTLVTVDHRGRTAAEADRVMGWRLIGFALVLLVAIAAVVKWKGQH